jgi:hypothetical protein
MALRGRQGNHSGTSFLVTQRLRDALSRRAHGAGFFSVVRGVAARTADDYGMRSNVRGQVPDVRKAVRTSDKP